MLWDELRWDKLVKKNREAESAKDVLGPAWSWVMKPLISTNINTTKHATLSTPPCAAWYYIFLVAFAQAQCNTTELVYLLWIQRFLKAKEKDK